MAGPGVNKYSGIIMYNTNKAPLGRLHAICYDSERNTIVGLLLTMRDLDQFVYICGIWSLVVADQSRYALRSDPNALVELGELCSHGCYTNVAYLCIACY
jgi:hypothetical protein